MEKKGDAEVISDDELLKLIIAVQNNDKHAMQRIIQLFEKDMIELSRFIRMPQEDALQSMKTELMDLIKNKKMI
ncbi:MAG TPA: helix-turn-helix domain-containing protein [Paenibacillus sp.]|uniref:helix-turn-helix domain-containing protein n=1 Tax=Paenibacillus sp. TaxID=58172 RepID=UPI0028D0128C|nr:helix-turn-helix domain-containing protein [Paenibacillus sp.]HUC93098.1 helix-turn-helix domain-containing protein [Paenibacillus sp.]